MTRQGQYAVSVSIETSVNDFKTLDAGREYDDAGLVPIYKTFRCHKSMIVRALSVRRGEAREQGALSRSDGPDLP